MREKKEPLRLLDTSYMELVGYMFEEMRKEQNGTVKLSEFVDHYYESHLNLENEIEVHDQSV